MAFDAHKNFAKSLVATAPSPDNSGTSLGVTAGTGTRFAAVSFNATVWPPGVEPTVLNAEIVRVTAISTDTFIITRAQEGTTARHIAVGDQICAGITLKTVTDIEGKFPVALGDGGTGQVSASAARGPSGIAAENFTSVSDADHICTATEHIIAYSSVTSVRTVTLPLANTVPAGHEISVVDVAGNLGGVVAINVVRTSPNTVDSGTQVTMSTASMIRTFASDGTSAWQTVDVGNITSPLSLAAGGTSATTKTAAFDALSPTTTQGDISIRGATFNVRLGAATSGQALITGGAGANPAWGAVVNVQAFTASGTWTKPDNATWVRVICIGSGGGGGSGRLGATGTQRGGGGSGAAGSWNVEDFQAADLPGTVTVTIPAGGAGGIVRSGATASGQNGGSPAAVTFGTFTGAASGGGGGGGTNSGGTAGAQTELIFPVPWLASSSAAGGAAGGVGSGANPGNVGPAGAPGSGGGGGGITNGNATDTGGGAGGAGGGIDHTAVNKLAGGAGGASTGAAGTAGTTSGTSPSSSLTGGSGGGGGSAGTGAANTTVGGAGAAGGTWGAGGGGGGAGTTVTSSGSSGAGGAGGKGYIIVCSYR